MKNIHVLPTDKPSRLFEIIKFNLSFDKTNYFSEEYKKLHKYKNKNIYITSNEEIKDGDYYLYLKNNSVQQFIKKHHTKLLALDFQKKITLTTDQDLIKDGVQAIDDDFLEWFVKNPNCEEINVKGINFVDSKIGIIKNHRYKIIIPKEETKTVFDQLEVGKDYKQEVFELGEETKQETLEEVALKLYPISSIPRKLFIRGAKWQQEQILDFLYSEITERRDYSASKMCEKVVEFIEQFKNK